MAESIAILFKKATWNELSNSIANLAKPVGSCKWQYPLNSNAYTLNLYEYDSWLTECDEEERTTIKSYLGVTPSSILCIELRHSVQNQACKDAVHICNILLHKFNGVVDDAVGKIWNQKEVKDSIEFLEIYRNNK